MLAKELEYLWKSEHLCFQKISSWPIFIGVGDHGNQFEAFAERHLGWSSALDMLQSRVLKRLLSDSMGVLLFDKVWR